MNTTTKRRETAAERRARREGEARFLANMLDGAGNTVHRAMRDSVPKRLLSRTERRRLDEAAAAILGIVHALRERT